MRKQRNETQEQVSDAIGINRSTYADYEKGKSEPIVSMAVKIAEYFSVTITDLLISDIDTPLFNKKSSGPPSLYNDGLRVLTITISEVQKGNIELVPINAVAGYSTGFNNATFIQELPRFNLPNLHEGTYRAFEISGDSMPPINKGFIVVGKFVERWQDLKNGKRYVLVLRNEGVVFKRVVNEVGQNKKLVLFSDNPTYLPFTISIADLLEAWEMKAFVGFTTEIIDTNEAILQKLQAVEQKLNLLTEEQR